MLCIRVPWVCLVCLLLCKEEGSSPVSVQLLREIHACMRALLSMSLLGFRMGTMLVNFHMCGIMLLLRAVLNMFMRNVHMGLCV